MFYPKRLDVVPCAIQQDLTAYPFFSCFFVFVFVFCLFRATVRHMEVLKLGGKLELELRTYTIATAMPDPSCVCNPHHTTRQCRILNPLSKARD